MIITNELNLPQALVDACDVSPHNAPNTVSATTLKNGVREILLTKRHWNEMSDDVANRIFVLFGTAVHALLEREAPDTFVEERFEKQIGKYKVTGKLDCYDMKQKIIFDYKTATTWKYKFNDFSDWRFQGLVYAWLLKQSGLEVNECRFVAMFKDFSKTKSKTEQNYPNKPVFVYRFNVMESDLQDIERKIIEKINALSLAENLTDKELPLCTEEERWYKNGKFAVMKKGRKSAVKLCDTKEIAEQYINAVGGDLYIEERKGTDGKCAGYCGCCEFCSYWKEHYANKEVEDIV